MGDPRGVGPELVATIACDAAITSRSTLTIFGDPVILDEAARQCGLPPTAQWQAEILAVSNDANWRSWDDATCGHHSREYVVRAVEFCLKQNAALVTAPINKHRWKLASGTPHGHTEFLQHLTQSPIVGMMMASPRLRTVPVTIHEPLARVASLLTAERIVSQAALTIQFLTRYFGIRSPRLAVTSLNPHAGEQGDLGNEESSIIEPAIHQLQQAGLNVSGPFPADGLFARAASNYDAIICMYHDQAMIPVKVLDFQNTVNVTMGLPFVRTSPDHGTAEDIAWKNSADAQHMRTAIKLATTLSQGDLK